VELYLIRHGQSTNNTLTDQLDRLCDPPLTELGRRQSERVAEHLADSRRGYGITRLYVSPMWRALQTARLIGQALGLAVEVWIEVHETGGIYLDHGEAGGIVAYPGKTRAEMLAEFPDYVLPETVTERGWWRGDGLEDWSACHGRAIQVAEQLRQWAAEDERIAIISHGGFANALLKALFNQLPSRHLWYAHGNTGITRIDFFDDGRLGVQFLNRMEHLLPEWIS
jgi:2,3-bisphosphoglycerate-dependent phosphoglycerate mutase